MSRPRASVEGLGKEMQQAWREVGGRRVLGGSAKAASAVRALSVHEEDAAHVGFQNVVL